MQIFYLALRLFYFLTVQHSVTETRFYRNSTFWKTGGIVWMSVSEQHVVTELVGSIGCGSCTAEVLDSNLGSDLDTIYTDWGFPQFFDSSAKPLSSTWFLIYKSLTNLSLEAEHFSEKSFKCLWHNGKPTVIEWTWLCFFTHDCSVLACKLAWNVSFTGEFLQFA